MGRTAHSVASRRVVVATMTAVALLAASASVLMAYASMGHRAFMLRYFEPFRVRPPPPHDVFAYYTQRAHAPHFEPFHRAQPQHHPALVSTLATDEFVVPAMVLALSWNETTGWFGHLAGVELVLGVTDEVSQEAKDLARLAGWTLLDVPQRTYAVPGFETSVNRRNFNKMFDWNLTQYDHVVTVDLDGMFMNDASEMFSPYWLPLSMYSGWQTSSGKFNAGVKILKPNPSWMKEVLHIFESKEWGDHIVTGGDQDLVNYFLETRNVQVKAFGRSYNAGAHYTSTADFSTAVYIHFKGPTEKPWNFPQLRHQDPPHVQWPTFEDCIKIWWRKMDELYNLFPEQTPLIDKMAAKMMKWEGSTQAAKPM
eukprot:TRINITY_DN1764_c0_g1_i10.p1 TRINITY_DN1764_c0_g1~~TRINITY_DN1764_c0_g1_i10.p1  ORF type:complete len:367 (+),score=91.61 TRINITY_DN1764_c0_g1_i10:32-1132(+)